jgi:hypothetical protein
MNFKKLKQLSNDIDLLEQSGKYTAAEVLHKKFIKEAQETQVVNNVKNYQARPGKVNERIVYPGQGNAFERGDNFARSERGGEGTLYNFKGLQPEMEPVRVQTSPGNFTTVLRPKNNIGNPYATRSADPFRNIPGYNELSRLTNDARLIRDFVEAKGTSTDAGMAIYNELMSQNSNRPVSNTTTQTEAINAPVTQTPVTQTPVTQTPATQTPATQTATQTAVGKTPTIDPNYKGYETPAATGPASVPSTEPQSAVTNSQVAFQGLGTAMSQGQGSSIPKLKERVDHYNKKIQEYKTVTDPKRKSEMLKYLNQYIKDNYDQGLLDPQSYRNLMTALEEKGS